jgi:hypothetical protein
MPEIPHDTIAAIHDRLHAVITGRTPLQMPDSERKALELQCGPLCWLLGHDNNPAFQIQHALAAYHDATRRCGLDRPADNHEALASKAQLLALDLAQLLVDDDGRERHSVPELRADKLEPQ